MIAEFTERACGVRTPHGIVLPTRLLTTTTQSGLSSRRAR